MESACNMHGTVDVNILRTVAENIVIKNLLCSISTSAVLQLTGHLRKIYAFIHNKKAELSQR